MPAVNPPILSLPHLEPLYALAQALTANPEAATALLEATYRHAYREGDAIDIPKDKAWWISQLIAVQHAIQEQGPMQPLVHPGHAAAVPGLIHARLTERLIDRILPAAFAALDAEARLLLMLRHAEGFSDEEIGAVMQLEPDVVEGRLAGLHAKVRRALADSADPSERALVTTLPEGWMEAGLQRMAATHLVPLPPTLRPTLAAALSPGTAVAKPPPSTRTVATARQERRQAQSKRARTVLMGVLLVVTAALVGYIGTRLVPEPVVETDLLLLSAQQAETIKPLFHSGSAEQAERYVYDRLGWRLTVPDIHGLVLDGVDISEIVPGVEVPAFVFESDSGDERVVLYAYNYALLDRHRDQIRLARDVLSQIEDESHFDLFDLDQRKVLIWRYQDEIFLAITEGDVADLRGRIAFPS